MYDEEEFTVLEALHGAQLAEKYDRNAAREIYWPRYLRAIAREKAKEQAAIPQESTEREEI